MQNCFWWFLQLIFICADQKRIDLNVLPSPSKQWKKWILGEVVINSIPPRKRFHPPPTTFSPNISPKKRWPFWQLQLPAGRRGSPLKGDRRQGHCGVCFAWWSCRPQGHREVPGGGGWVRPKKDGSSKKPRFLWVLFWKCLEWMDPQYTWFFLEKDFSFEDEFRVHHLLTCYEEWSITEVFQCFLCLGITLHTCMSIETKGVLFTFKKDAYGVMEGATHSAQRLATIRDKELRVECRGEGSVRCGGLPWLPSLAKAPEN